MNRECSAMSAAVADVLSGTPRIIAWKRHGVSRDGLLRALKRRGVPSLSPGRQVGWRKADAIALQEQLERDRICSEGQSPTA